MGPIYISHLIEDEKLKQILEEYPGVGIETIEFGIGENLDRGEEKKTEYLKRMEPWISRRPFSVHGPFLDLNPASYDTLITEATMKRFFQTYEIAEALKADRLVFHSGFNPVICYEEGWPEKSAEFWLRFLDRTDGSVKIHMENVLDEHWEVFAEVFERVNCPYFTVCFDAGHAKAYAKQSEKDWVLGLGKKIGHLHVHDNDGSRDAHLALGQGTIEWKMIIDMVKGCEREAAVTIENNKEEAIRVSLDYLSGNLDLK